MIAVEGMTKRYRGRKGIVSALNEVSFVIEPGTLTVVKGASGSGKSTLLLALGGMLRPSAGRVLLGDKDLYAMHAGARARVRARQIGFVFQMFHLVPYLSVEQNVRAGAQGIADRRQQTQQLLERLGMIDRAGHRPGQLSAGEKQRTAVARALIGDPALILADEPTGNLDPDNAAVVIGALRDARNSGKAVVMVTHGNDADGEADRILTLRNGQLVSL